MRNEMDEALRNEETKPPHRHTRGHPKERSNPIANLGSVRHRKRSVLSHEIKNAWDFEVLPAQSFKVAKSYWFVVTVLVPSLLVRADSDFRVVAKRHQRLRLASRRQRYQPHASLVQNRIPIHAAFKRLSRLEGIIPALETSHALAYLEKLCPTLPDGAKVVLNCSGRGDKDVHTAIKHLQV